MCFKRHINLSVKTCNYHILNLYAVKKFLDERGLLALVHSLILSRVDYCNTRYVRLSKYLLRKLLSILYRTARIISAPPEIPNTPFLIELHRLPVTERVELVSHDL